MDTASQPGVPQASWALCMSWSHIPTELGEGKPSLVPSHIRSFDVNSHTEKTMTENRPTGSKTPVFIWQTLWEVEQNSLIVTHLRV